MTRQTILTAVEGKSLGNQKYLHTCVSNTMFVRYSGNRTSGTLLPFQATTVGRDTEMYFNHYIKLVSFAQP